MHICGSVTRVAAASLEIAGVTIHAPAHTLEAGDVAAVVAQMGDQGIWHGVILGSNKPQVTERNAATLPAQTQAPERAAFDSPPPPAPVVSAAGAPARGGSRAARYARAAAPAPARASAPAAAAPTAAAGDPASKRPPFHFSRPGDAKVKL